VEDVFSSHRVKNAVMLGVIVGMYAPTGTPKKETEKRTLTAKEIQKSAAKVESPLAKVLREVDELRKAGLYVDYEKER